MGAPAGMELLSEGSWNPGSVSGEWSPGGCGCGSGEPCSCGGSCGCKGGSGGSCGGGKPSGEVPLLPDYDGEIWASPVRAVASQESHPDWVDHLLLQHENHAGSLTPVFGDGAIEQPVGGPSIVVTSSNECTAVEGMCDGCWPMLSWDLALAGGAFPVPRIIDPLALFPDPTSRYLELRAETSRGIVPSFVESISVAVTKDDSKPGECEAQGAEDCRIVKGCAFDLQLTLNSKSFDAFDVVGSGNKGAVLKSGAKGVKVVFKEEVACGAEAKLKLKRVRALPPGVIQLAEEESDTEISLGRCDRCYKRC